MTKGLKEQRRQRREGLKGIAAIEEGDHPQSAAPNRFEGIKMAEQMKRTGETIRIRSGDRDGNGKQDETGSRNRGKTGGRWRPKSGMSLTQLSKAARIDRSYLARIANGKRQPSLRVALSVAQVLGQPVEEVVEEIRQTTGQGQGRQGEAGLRQMQEQEAVA